MQSAYDWQRAGRLRGCSSNPGRGKSSPCHIFQADSSVHPSSYSMGTGGSFPWGKAAGKGV
jgi:hypothetical protein